MRKYRCLTCNKAKDFELFDPGQRVDREIRIGCLLTPKELAERGGRCGFRNDEWTSD